MSKSNVLQVVFSLKISTSFVQLCIIRIFCHGNKIRVDSRKSSVLFSGFSIDLIIKSVSSILLTFAAPGLPDGRGGGGAQAPNVGTPTYYFDQFFFKSA